MVSEGDMHQSSDEVNPDIRKENDKGDEKMIFIAFIISGLS